MKKFLTKMIPLTLLVLALCMTSVVVSANSVTLDQPTYADGTVTVKVTPEESSQVVVLVVDGSNDTTYLENAAAAALQPEIVYVDQASATTAGFTFNFIPNEAVYDDPTAEVKVDSDQMLTVYASGTDATVEVKTLSIAPTVTRNVTLNTNGGIIASGKEVTEYTEGTAKALPTEEEITKTGYKFAGWFEDAEFTGDAVSAIPETATDDKTYYAKWKLVVAVEEDITVDGGASGADAGYYTKADNKKEYAISVTAKVNTTLVGDIVRYGFVVYKEGKLAVENGYTLDGTVQLDADGYYTIAYGIPEDKLGEYVHFLPFVADAYGNIFYGNVKECCVTDFPGATEKYLGTAEVLGFN